MVTRRFGSGVLPVWMVLAACEPAPPSVDTGEDDAPAEWTYETDSAPREGTDAVAVETAIRWSLDRLAGVTARDLLDAYLQVLEHAGPTCPDLTAGGLGVLYWDGSCTTMGGDSFDGWAFARRDGGFSDGAGGTCASLDYYFGFARIIPPNGHTVDAWGASQRTDCTSADGTRVVADFESGYFHVAGAEGWLADDVPIDVLLQRTQAADGGRSVSLHGGHSELTGPTATTIFAVRANTLVLDAADTCKLEPRGSISAWDVNENEYTLTFDGACDGCGTVTWREGTLGTACVDFAPYRALLQAP